MAESRHAPHHRVHGGALRPVGLSDTGAVGCGTEVT
jgi:hypothetical protein